MVNLKRKMSKVFLALLMVVTMFVTQTQVGAAGITENGFSDKVISVVADKETNIPDFEDFGGAGPFGQKAGEGRIWVDKSVISNNSGTFDVHLSALTQEYTAVVASSAGSSSTSADVIFLLDASGSMLDKDVTDKSGKKVSRMQALVDATNEAIRIITKANPKNRFAIYFTNGEQATKQLLPMDTYTLVNGQTDVLQSMPDHLRGIKKAESSVTWTDPWIDAISNSFPDYTFVNYNLRNSAGAIAGGTLYDSAFDSGNVGAPGYYTLVSPNGGTPTQRSVVTGIQNAINEINGSGQTNERMPFVFLMSDGGATYGNSTWWDPAVASGGHNLGKGSEGLESNTEEKLSDITANLVLSSSFMKEELTKAYNAYNDKNGHGKHETKFYTLGLGSDINGPTIVSGGKVTDFEKYAWIGLQPEAIEPAINNSPFWSADQVWDAKQTLAATNVKDKLDEYIQKAVDAGIADAAKYKDPKNYDYSYYYKNAVSSAEIEEAFGKLANDVASATTSFLPPVDETVIGTEAASIYYEDVVGEGFQVDGEFKITINKTTEIVGKNTADKPNLYSFDGLDGKVVIATDAAGIQTVKWYLSGDDLKNCLYTIKLGGGGYNPADKMILNYTLKPKSDTLDSGKSYYTNQFNKDASNKITGGTKVTFYPSKMNPYYFYANDLVGIVDELKNVGYTDTATAGKDTDITHFVKGSAIPAVTNGENLKQVYITTAMALSDDCPNDIKPSNIGTLKDITVNDALVNFNAELVKSIKDCKPAENADKTSTEKTFGFLTGIQKVHDHTVKKVDNNTKTAEMVSVEDFKDGKITMTLGNNGLLETEMAIEKSATSIVNAGGVITFKITVHNSTSSDKTGVVVQDVLASDLTDITNKTASTVKATYSLNGKEVKWEDVTVPANSSVDLIVEAKVPASAAAGTAYKNTAKLVSVDSVKLPNSAVSNETETKVTTNDIKISVNKDGSSWTDHGKNITLVDPSNPGKEYDLTDTIPDGTYEIFDNKTNTKVTIEIKNNKGVATIQYFTVTLNKGQGIASVTGQGIYLAGTEIEIDTTLENGYDFVNWTGSNNYAQTKNKIKVDRKLEFTANAKSKGGSSSTDDNKDSPSQPAPDSDTSRNPNTADKSNPIYGYVLVGSFVVIIAVLVYKNKFAKQKKVKK